jgi:quinol-cytochrome oxidoreductase complex cytochrome b subunit
MFIKLLRVQYKLYKFFILPNTYFNKSLKMILYYFTTLSVAFHDYMSLFGFFSFLIIMNQLISGTMLAFSLVPEPMMIPLVREEEDAEDLYSDDFFWLHERGVDLLFIFVFFHLLRKMYLSVYSYEQEYAWKSGAFSFLIIQLVVFLGLVLCCTHLSEITLTIAANALHTFFFFKGKVYWWLFTDRFLNTDTIIRLAYLHYVSAFFLTFIAVIHGVDMHYDWKNEDTYDGIKAEMVWWDEALSNEVSKSIDIILLIGFFCFFLYEIPEALTYEIFMWGDVGMSTDVRFYGVAPHWYFRPYMAWLIVCPKHRPGLFGLIYFFVVLFYQPNINGTHEQKNYKTNIFVFNMFKFEKNKKYQFKLNKLGVEYSIFYQLFYVFFLMCIFYSTTFLPYGRFYNRIGGNVGMLTAYLYIFFYLAFSGFKRSIIVFNHKNNYYSSLKQF